MAKFDSATVVRRKLWPEFGKNTSSLTCIADAFKRFCEIDTVVDRDRSGRPSLMTEVDFESNFV